MFVKLALLVTVFAVSSVSASSQSNAATPASDAPPCPVKIEKIDPTGNESFSHGLMSGGSVHSKDGKMFVLKTKNESGKDIKGMIFQAAYFDAVEDTTDIPLAWQWTDPLPAGEEKSFRWANIYTAESKVGWRVRLTKVLYADGSKWEPASGQVCSSEYFRDKHHK